MKILFLSFYYSPDLAAGSFRSAALIKSLLSVLPKGATVELITTMPNRYASYTLEAQKTEKQGCLTIRRINIPKHKSGMFDQSLAFGAYAMKTIQLTNGNNYDLIFSTSSRLMTGLLGAFLARRLRVPLYLDIRDIFVDTIEDIFSPPWKWLLQRIFSNLENYLVNSADSINLISRGFLPYFEKRYPDNHYTVFTNGVDEQFLKSKIRCKEQNFRRPLTVVYAGNFGEGQGLHNIVPKLAKRFEGTIQFVLVGDGGQKQKLLSAIKMLGCKNIEIQRPLDRKELWRLYQKADILFLHLNDHKAFEKVLPSKLFEYASTGKPIWAGLKGYASDFMNENIDNCAIFSPFDIEEAELAFKKLKVVTKPRHRFNKKFSSREILDKMAKDIIRFAQKDEV